MWLAAVLIDAAVARRRDRPGTLHLTGHAGEPDVDVRGPVIGFREWRLRRGRLWSVSHRDDPLPPGDLKAVCLRSQAVTAGEDHVVPAPSGVCSCGLYAYHEVGSLDTYADVVGTVLAWGRIEVHADGFRSEWQRPIALAPALFRSRVGHKAMIQVARRYHVPLVRFDDIGVVAREHGDPVPVEAIPVMPLKLLSHHGFWRSPLSSGTGELLSSIRVGSVRSRSELAARATDLAVAAAFERARTSEFHELHLLENALTGSLCAVETAAQLRFSPSRRHADQQFRSVAKWSIERLLDEQGARDRSGSSPVTYGHVRARARQLGGPPAGIPPAPRASQLMTTTQAQRLLPQLDQLMDQQPEANRCDLRAVWRQIRHIAVPSAREYGLPSLPLAREMYAIGNRDHFTVHQLVDGASTRPGQRAMLRTIADDPEVDSWLRARALGRLAQQGSLQNVLEFLAHDEALTNSLESLSHPLQRPPAPARMLARYGDEGKAAARAMLARPTTDAQLSACIGLLGAEAAEAAARRLARRPPPCESLVRDSLRALPSCKAADIICARIESGEALRPQGWLLAVGGLSDEDQQRVLQDLLAKLSRIPDKGARGERLWDLLGADKRQYLPQRIQNALRAIAAHNPDLLDPTELSWLLGQEDTTKRIQRATPAPEPGRHP
jgi:hypothetical protein